MLAFLYLLCSLPVAAHIGTTYIAYPNKAGDFIKLFVMCTLLSGLSELVQSEERPFTWITVLPVALAIAGFFIWLSNSLVDDHPRYVKTYRVASIYTAFMLSFYLVY